MREYREKKKVDVEKQKLQTAPQPPETNHKVDIPNNLNKDIEKLKLVDA